MSLTIYLPWVTKTGFFLTISIQYQYNINTISIQYQPDNWWEKRKILMWGWLVDPILNSLNSHYNKCMVDSKEKYKFDLGVKELIAFT